MSNPVIAVKGVRLSDYNGISLSTITRSALAVEPDVPAAKALRDWYAREGASVKPVEAGAGLANARGGSGGGKAARRTFAQIEAEPLPATDAKPEWCTLYGSVVFLNADKASGSMYYPACPQEGCNKKVVENGDGTWRCEACNQSGGCKRRFILRLKVADATAASWVNVFDDQGKQLFGCSADELHAEREAVRAWTFCLTQCCARRCSLPMRPAQDEALFQRRLKDMQWRPWVLKAKVTADTYKDKTQRRITAVAVNKPDYAAESAALLAAMAA